MKRVFAIVAFLVIASMVLGACTPAASPTAVPPTKPPAAGEPTKPPATAEPTKAPVPTATAAPARPKVLRVNVGTGTYPDNLDPHLISYANEIAVTSLLYEGLTTLDPKGVVGPGAAEKWSTSADGKTMTFNLRSGLKRADGTPLTAKDFEYAFKRLVDPRLQGEYNTLIDDVVGAEECHTMDAKSKPEDIAKMQDKVGVKATNDTTLQITFKAPVGYWTYIAYTWVGWPVDPKAVAKDPENWWTKAEGHNGNGPFKISKIEENRSITFVPNPNYRGGKAKLDRIEFYFITDTAVAFEAYRKGELDIVDVAAEDRAAVAADPVLSKEFLEFPATSVAYMGMHQLKPPFDKKEVRMAFAQAFDRDAYTRDILKGKAKTYLSWVPPGVPGADTTALQKGYDPAGAVKTLIDAGYAAANSTAQAPKIDCKKLGDIKLTYSGTPRNHARFQFIAGNFARVFGCPVTLDPVDPTVYTAMTKKVETAPQIFLLNWIQDYPHPQNWLFIMKCGGLHASRIAYCNKDYDAALAVADLETDLAKAVGKYQAAQKVFLADYASASLYYNLNWSLIKPYVIGPKDNYSVSDVWPGEYGPILTYDIDLTKVGAGYPTK